MCLHSDVAFLVPKTLPKLGPCMIATSTKEWATDSIKQSVFSAGQPSCLK